MDSCRTTHTCSGAQDVADLVVGGTMPMPAESLEPRHLAPTRQGNRSGMSIADDRAVPLVVHDGLLHRNAMHMQRLLTSMSRAKPRVPGYYSPGHRNNEVHTYGKAHHSGDTLNLSLGWRQHIRINTHMDLHLVLFVYNMFAVVLVVAWLQGSIIGGESDHTAGETAASYHTNEDSTCTYAAYLYGDAVQSPPRLIGDVLFIAVCYASLCLVPPGETGRLNQVKREATEASDKSIREV